MTYKYHKLVKHALGERREWEKQDANYHLKPSRFGFYFVILEAFRESVRLLGPQQ